MKPFPLLFDEPRQRLRVAIAAHGEVGITTNPAHYIIIRLLISSQLDLPRLQVETLKALDGLTCQKACDVMEDKFPTHIDHLTR